ncbi:MAG: MBL fold metallo-hydrolase [Deltaproteobacteria bacterium]|nr:MBL fold metallo-hydrolase [Deltaproteobacteria bacterium]
MITVRTLASGSSGNMTLIRSDRSTIVLDVGVRSQRRTLELLGEAGVGLDSLDAAIVSHSHTDHLGRPGLKLCVEAGVPLMAGRHTIEAAVRLHPWNGNNGRVTDAFVTIRPKDTYLVGDIEVTPFEVAHDVPTFGFVFEKRGPGGGRVAVATDLGHAPDELLPWFTDADVILLEANYDEGMLRVSPRSHRDKARVASGVGHLSNLQAGRFLARAAAAGMKLPSYVVLVHLSRDHNRPEVAVDDVSTYLDPGRGHPPDVAAAPPDRPGPIIEVDK